MIVSGVYSLAIMTWLLYLLIKEHILKGYSNNTRITILIQLPIWLYILATLIERIRTY